MNKIEIINNNINIDVNSDIIINDYTKLPGISKGTLFLFIPENVNTKLILNLNDNNYQKFCFFINNNSSIEVLEIKENNNNKNDYHFILNKNSKAFINKFNNCGETLENIKIDLKGENSKIIYNFSTLTNNNQTYCLNINHLSKGTISTVNNKGVVFNDSKLNFIVNGIVPKGMSNSILDQNNSIITMANNNCIIEPNLYIDEYLVEAKHGASIGKFNQNEVFYLKSRGIKEKECYNLLIRGFLLADLRLDENKKEKINNIIEGLLKD